MERTSLETFNTRTFDAFGRLTYENQKLVVNGYVLFFRGWLAVADTTLICGQWLAWPQRPVGPNPRYFIAQATPEDMEPIVQEYRPGESFQLCNRVYAEFLHDPAQQLLLLGWALRAKDALVERVRATA